MLARRPARLRTAVLLDKKPRRQVDVPVEYAGFEIPDLWVVGYGLDDGENYRNLSDIRYVRDET
jgi:hypoxanthine phosphoribosyltransferase